MDKFSSVMVIQSQASPSYHLSRYWSENSENAETQEVLIFQTFFLLHISTAFLPEKKLLIALMSENNDKPDSHDVMSKQKPRIMNKLLRGGTRFPAGT